MNVKPISVPSTPSRVVPKLSQEYDLCESEQKVVIYDDVPTPTPPPTPVDPVPNLQAEIRLLQKSLLSRRSASSADTAIKHFYISNAGTLTAATPGVFGTLNSIAQGTTAFTRIGNAINNRTLTIRMLLRFVPNGTSSTLLDWVPPQIRFVVWRNAVPDNIPPTVNEFCEYTSGVPTSDISVFTSSAAGYPNHTMTAFRNPYTFDRNHVYLDEKINIHQDSWLAGTGTCMTGAKNFEWHIDFHKAKTTFYAATGNQIVTNNMCYALVVEHSAGTAANTPANVSYQYTGDLTFNDADMT